MRDREGENGPTTLSSWDVPGGSSLFLGPQDGRRSVFLQPCPSRLCPLLPDTAVMTTPRAFMAPAASVGTQHHVFQGTGLRSPVLWNQERARDTSSPWVDPRPPVRARGALTTHIQSGAEGPLCPRCPGCETLHNLLPNPSSAQDRGPLLPAKGADSAPLNPAYQTPQSGDPQGLLGCTAGTLEQLREWG